MFLKYDHIVDALSVDTKLFLEMNGAASFLIDAQTNVLLIGIGIISGLPLIIFIIGSRLINLSLIGILQYIYPILILLIGVYIYDEQLLESRIVGFLFIWFAVVVYIIDEIQFRNTKLVQEQ